MRSCQSDGKAALVFLKCLNISISFRSILYLFANLTNLFHNGTIYAEWFMRHLSLDSVPLTVKQDVIAVPVTTQVQVRSYRPDILIRGRRYHPAVR